MTIMPVPGVQTISVFSQTG